MITKAKKVQFTASDGTIHDNIEDAKRNELFSLIGAKQDMTALSALEQIVALPREAIAILKVGLPRKPRTVKTKTTKGKRAAAVNAALQDMKQ